MWDQVVPQLERMGVLAKADHNAMSRYCHFWGRWAEQFIEENGESYPLKDDSGKVKYHQQFPQVAIASLGSSASSYAFAARTVSRQ